MAYGRQQFRRPAQSFANESEKDFFKTLIRWLQTYQLF